MVDRSTGVIKAGGSSSVFWNKHWLVSVLSLTGVFLLFSAYIIPAGSTRSQPVVANVADFFAEFPMRFQTNSGDFGHEVKFFSKGYQYDLLFTAEQVMLNLYGNEQRRKSLNMSQIGIQFLDRVGKPLIEGNRPVAEESSTDGSITQAGAIEGDTGYLEVKYKNMYPGIDVYFHGKQKQLYYDFVLSEKASTEVLRMKIVGAGDEAIVDVDIHGNVSILCEDKKMKINKPTVYRMINDQKVPVSGYFFVTRHNEIRFKQVG